MKKTKRVTKTGQVLEHLQSYGFIDTWTAIQSYGATRLSAIIFNLKDRGHDITSVPEIKKDRNGNTTQYSRYILKTDKKDV